MEEQNCRNVIEIKDDEDKEECMHRIKEFYRCKTCDNLAQICVKECPGVQHQEVVYNHQRINYDEFKHSFRKFDEEFALQIKHYARQIEQIQFEAIEGIKKKKADTLKHLDSFKTDLVKMTYPDLQTLHTTLYQKLKNQRYDRLKCNEVDWMISTARRRIPFKHSEINKKMETIVKSFQNFKDVSKNLASRSFTTTNKTKAKTVKQDLKNAEFYVAPPVAQITLPLIDYTEERNAKISDQLSEDMNRKKKEIEKLTNIITELRKDANGLIDRIRKQNRLTLCSNVLVIVLASQIQQDLKSKPIARVMEPFWSSYKNYNEQSAPFAPSNLLKVSNSAQKASIPQNINPFQPYFASKTNQISKLSKQMDSIHLNSEKEAEVEDERRDQRSSSHYSKNQHHEVLPNQGGQMNEQNHQSKPSNQPQEAQNQHIEKEPRQEEQEDQSQSSSPRPVRKEPVVKHEEVQEKQASTWGIGLLDQMRKYGHTQNKALKTENIDGLRRFPTYSFNSSIRSGNSLFRSNYFEEKKYTIGPQQFLAIELCQKSQKKKESKLAEEEKK